MRRRGRPGRIRPGRRRADDVGQLGSFRSQRRGRGGQPRLSGCVRIGLEIGVLSHRDQEALQGRGRAREHTQQLRELTGVANRTDLHVLQHSIPLPDVVLLVELHHRVGLVAAVADIQQARTEHPAVGGELGHDLELAGGVDLTEHGFRVQSRNRLRQRRTTHTRQDAVGPRAGRNVETESPFRVVGVVELETAVHQHRQRSRPQGRAPLLDEICVQRYRTHRGALSQQFPEMGCQALACSGIRRIQLLELDIAQQAQMLGIPMLAVAQHQVALQELVQLVRGGHASPHLVGKPGRHDGKQQTVELPEIGVVSGCAERMALIEAHAHPHRRVRLVLARGIGHAPQDIQAG